MSSAIDTCRYLFDDGSECPRARVDNSPFCMQHALPADLAVYAAVTDHFKQDVREFWVRSNFYLLVQAGLISVFAAVIPKASEFQRAIGLAMGAVGLAVALVWFVVARGAVKWIRRWREKTIEIDTVVDRHRIYAQVESLAQANPLMSPSNVTQYLPLVFCVAWIVLIAETIWLS
jgi:hypothetical protein